MRLEFKWLKYIMSKCMIYLQVTLRRFGILNNKQPNGLAIPDASMLPVNSTLDVLDMIQFGFSNRAMSSVAVMKDVVDLTVVLLSAALGFMIYGGRLYFGSSRDENFIRLKKKNQSQIQLEKSGR